MMVVIPIFSKPGFHLCHQCEGKNAYSFGDMRKGIAFFRCDSWQGFDTDGRGISLSALSACYAFECQLFENPPC